MAVHVEIQRKECFPLLEGPCRGGLSVPLPGRAMVVLPKSIGWHGVGSACVAAAFLSSAAMHCAVHARRFFGFEAPFSSSGRSVGKLVNTHRPPHVGGVDPSACADHVAALEVDPSPATTPGDGGIGALVVAQRQMAQVAHAPGNKVLPAPAGLRQAHLIIISLLPSSSGTEAVLH